MNLAADGVELWTRSIPTSVLEAVIEEYEGSVPETTAVPKHVPIVVYRTHVEGKQRTIQLLAKMPQMLGLAKFVALMLRTSFPVTRLRLLETVIFNKPPKESGVLHWHQDVSYFALEPNDQLAVWIPFDNVTAESGAMQYALGSHKLGMRASRDLHTNELLDPSDKRPAIDPTGLQIFCAAPMYPGDMLVHDGRTWHMSGPNTVLGQPRRGLSFRFIVGDVVYDPRPGAAAPFLKQINDLEAGQPVEDPAFPDL